ncbi:PfkB family carbohydrate kinase [Parasedimentitalea maritima]|uniref:L-rhamnose mutarotase n=1 Tax=Parasedimentitalea maritima TaxID=2578117 RepID=A0A6A4RD84_9RHOB|nr:PfkB family carbohydrate kinase [Zongyanglinia marina]KAE9627680.1 L-rhamnose mutarotase [Zongyanglinia marina]
MTYRVVCIGEPLAEVSRQKPKLSVGFGGDTLNTAIYCAREVQGQDVAVHYVTAVGQDVLSNSVVELMQSEGIGTDYVSRDPHRQIGIYAIQNDERGERSFHYWRDASAAREMFKSETSLHLEAIKAADLAYLSGITLAILTQDARDRLWIALAERRKSGLQVAFDSNYRPKLWETPEIARREIARFWEISDIALPSQEDESDLFGDRDNAAIVDRIMTSGAKKGALKCGADGPVSLPLSVKTQVFAAAETVVDTTGAGDSFNGAYLASIVCKKTHNTALASAHDLACRVVGQQGAILPKTQSVTPQRMGSVIQLKPEHLDEYKRLHADVWPGVLQRLRSSNFSNYSIYLKHPECLMFGYFEYTGSDFAADNAAIAADPITKDWWAVCGPMQEPFETRADGEWWAEMEEVFHLD